MERQAPMGIDILVMESVLVQKSINILMEKIVMTY